MGRYVKQEQKRTELQERIAADLRARAEQKSKQIDSSIDGVEDSAYIEGLKSTTSLAWLWLLVLLFGIGCVAVVIWRANTA